MDPISSRRAFLGTTAGSSALAGLTMGLAMGLGMEPVTRADGAEGRRSATDPASAASAPRTPAPLRILVLGGTGQTGPFFVRQALAHGHEVTLLNRGRRSGDLFPDVECIVGDRDPSNPDGLRNLVEAIGQGRRWDVVLDVWPHIPKIVEQTASLLKESADRYAFVSSVSVYVDNATRGQNEDAPVGQAPDADDIEFTMALYGPFKAECENRVRRHFGDRSMIFRSGLIVGPRDFSGRGVYWPVRVRRGGEVLAPGDGATRVQLIDARDLVAFQLRCMETGANGNFNVIGPHPNRPLTMRSLLEACRSTSNADATFTWVPAEFLAEQGVGPWMQMPCWVPAEGDYAGFGWRSIDRAVAAGLTFRPLSETIEDTLQWYDGLSEEARTSVDGRAGITAERESAVLAAWSASQGHGAASSPGDESTTEAPTRGARE